MDKTKKVILDTNFLMIPCTENIDIFQEIQRLVKERYGIFTFSGVIRELGKIRDSEGSKGRDKIAARVALQMVEKKDINVLESHEKVDEAIIDFAKRDGENTIVCTNDKELKRKLRRSNVRVICMRDKNHLDFA